MLRIFFPNWSPKKKSQQIHNDLKESEWITMDLTINFELVTGVAAFDEKTCGLKQNGDGLAASIFTWSGAYIDAEGSDAVLLCRATGNPAPKVTWFNRYDEPITTGTNFQVITFLFIT